MQTYQDYIDASKRALSSAQSLASTAELIKIGEIKKDKTMMAWLDYEFESSSTLTPEFALFARQFKNYIKKAISPNLKLVSFSRGHFEVSGFIQNPNTDLFAYFSTSDVRYFKNSWFNNILVRTASSDKDYTGGRNNTCALPNLAVKLAELTS